MSEHPFLKGIGMGMIAGAAVGAAMMKNEKTIKRTAQQTVKSVGKLAEDGLDNLANRMPK